GSGRTEAGPAGGPPHAVRSVQDFTPPAVRPSTIRRWNSSTAMTSGMVTTTPAAIWVPNGWSNAYCPVNCDTITFAVLNSFLLITLTAMMNSFHAAMNTRIAVVNTPGAASGRITLRNACAGVQP